MKFTKKNLKKICTNFLCHAGVDIKISKQVVDKLISSEISGHPSHGIIRLIQYFEGIKKKIIMPNAKIKIKTKNNLTLLECNRSFGQVSMDRAIKTIKNKDKDISIVAVNNCSHIGRLSDYLEGLCSSKYISFIFCNGGGPNSAIYPSAERICGTNPFGFGMPVNNRKKIIVDFSTSMIAEGKVRIKKTERKLLNHFAIINKRGFLSNKPDDFYNGGSLLPFGGRKGSGLMLVCELLGGLLISKNNPLNIDYKDGNNCLIIAIKKRIFDFNKLEFLKQYNQLIKKIKFSKKLKDVSKGQTYMPNEWERSNIIKNKKNNFININDNVINNLKQYANKNKFKFI